MYGFANSNDVFSRNIVSPRICQLALLYWGKETDYNIFPDSVSLKAARSRGTDKHSVCGYLDFVDPKNGDFRLKDGSIAFQTGFKNFAMDSFGVVSPRLKTLAKKPALPAVMILDDLDDNEVIDFIGARVKNLATLANVRQQGWMIQEACWWWR